MELFTKMGAFWPHDGNPARPHAELTSGNHSGGFFNGSKVIEDPEITRRAMEDLYLKISRVDYMDSNREYWVVGSALGACSLAHAMAQAIGCKCAFTEPVIKDEKKVMELKRFEIPSHATAIVVEDVLTTGGTTKQTIHALETQAISVFGQIGVLVNRSGESSIDGVSYHNRFGVVSLIEKPMPIWTPEECPLCKQGSKAVRPKGNWLALTAEY
ncbi:MAG TPA: phosphoribosyltransferase family protein [Candidatus Paceibacterota bacterium]|nr:phosphoribosyltransferase family protein [Candidatus Paceibacterota bacterium]